MLGWFRKLLPHEDKFFDLYAEHSETIVAAAAALEEMLSGKDVEANIRRIFDLEDKADGIAREVKLAVRRTFITPFDRTDIKDLIQSLDDTIDTMNRVAKTVTLFERQSFDPIMKEMGEDIIKAAHLIAEAIPLLKESGKNALRLTAISEAVVHVEGHSDDLHEAGIKELFLRCRHGDAMDYIVDSKIYAELEKVLDRFEDVANEISGIVIENV